MNLKQKIMKVLRDLPVNASIEEAIETLLSLAKAEKGLRKANSGKTLSREKVIEKMEKWLP